MESYPSYTITKSLATLVSHFAALTHYTVTRNNVEVRSLKHSYFVSSEWEPQREWLIPVPSSSKSAMIWLKYAVTAQVG